VTTQIDEARYCELNRGVHFRVAHRTAALRKNAKQSSILSEADVSGVYVFR